MSSSAPASDMQAVEELHRSFALLKKELGKVIIGQEAVVEQLIIALLSNGHCLLIGVPGLAKTLLISSIARTLDLSFNRIQFTPDLMPSDITGTELIEEEAGTGRRQFRFVQGPIFSNMILADEINRTPPKTQAALLQAMQEHEVTASGKTYHLQEPFFVLATQNPIEQEGTYPLPEAQLDRFMFNILVDYPSETDERAIVKATTVAQTAKVNRAISAEEIIRYQQLVRRVPVSDALIDYAVSIVRATRPKETGAQEFIRNWVSWGAGPRASQALVLAAKTRAILDGRPTPGPEDIQFAAYPVLRHRIVTSFSAEADGVQVNDIIARVLESVKPR